MTPVGGVGQKFKSTLASSRNQTHELSVTTNLVTNFQYSCEKYYSTVENKIVFCWPDGPHLMEPNMNMNMNHDNNNNLDHFRFNPKSDDAIYDDKQGAKLLYETNAIQHSNQNTKIALRRRKQVKEMRLIAADNIDTRSSGPKALDSFANDKAIGSWKRRASLMSLDEIKFGPPKTNDRNTIQPTRNPTISRSAGTVMMSRPSFWKPRSASQRMQMLLLMSPSRLLQISVLLVILAQQSPVTESVDCFICQSRNGSNPACEDPFDNLYTTRITSSTLPDPRPNVSYQTPCYASRKGRNGVFPASACLKLSGTFGNGENIVVRHCGLDSGTLTQDTEIVRVSHCGSFQLDGNLLKGCMMACVHDACNSAPKSLNPGSALYIILLLLLIIEFLIL